MATTEGSPVSDQSGVSDANPSEKARHTGLRLAIGILSIVVGILVDRATRRHPGLPRGAVRAATRHPRHRPDRCGRVGSASPRWLKILSIVLGILTIIAG